MFLLDDIILGIAISFVGYLLSPKPKAPKPAAAQDITAPTAEAGRPAPYIAGTITTTGPNVIWFGDKKIIERDVKD
jgi:hypothetical protein